MLEQGGLFYDRRKRHVRGRTLARDVPSLGLCSGDRLEPSQHLQDVDLFLHTECPFVARFWRSRFFQGKCIDALNHRNPLFSDPVLMLSPSMSFQLDVLHVLYLGVHCRLLAICFWQILRGNPWRIPGPFETVVEVGLQIIRDHLHDWYDEQGVPKGDRVNELTPGMIGKDRGADQAR